VSQFEAHNHGMPEGEVRYCTTSDGTSIAYSVVGTGTPIYILPWFGESFSLMYLVSHYQRFFNDLGDGRSLIYADVRGCGLSQREVDDLSFETLVHDLSAVTDATGVGPFSIWAGGAVAQVAIAYAARNPAKVTNLILYAPSVQKLDNTQRQAGLAFAQLARTQWETFTRTIADGELRRRSDETGLKYAQWLQQSTSGDCMARLFEVFLDVDVTPLVTHVAARTLILHRRDDGAYALGQQLAARIPGARFVPLPEGSIFTDNNDPVISAIDRFLGDREESPRRPTVVSDGSPSLRTVLFTDLVGHTEMMRRLGDERGREVLREHERITRELLKQHGGAEVKTMGDGFMASFGSVTKAMDCAIALQRAFAGGFTPGPSPSSGEGSYKFDVRIGLNAGEPIEEDGDLFGSTVIMASRIAAQAGAGEILIPEPLRHLLSGKSYVYADRGETMLKGFEDAVRLYEVRWRA
jgi:class 3 adenylate cyclase